LPANGDSGLDVLGIQINHIDLIEPDTDHNRLIGIRIEGNIAGLSYQGNTRLFRYGIDVAEGDKETQENERQDRQFLGQFHGTSINDKMDFILLKGCALI
jgi:hypothetical protein